MCEGANDIDFLRTMIPILFPDENFLEQMQIWASQELCCNPARHSLTKEIVKELTAQPNPNVIFLRDRDFFAKDANEDEFVWTYPSIESYLFLYMFETQQVTLQHFLDPFNQFQYSTKFYNSYWGQRPGGKEKKNKKIDGTTVVADVCYPDDMKLLWIAACESAKKLNPTINDAINVLKVLHGHTWIDATTNYKGTSDLLRKEKWIDMGVKVPQLKEDLTGLLVRLGVMKNDKVRREEKKQTGSLESSETLRLVLLEEIV